MSYEKDRQWSDRFIPMLKLLIGQHLLATSSFEQDAYEASDLVVFNVLNRKIACRVRRYGYADRYQHQFTIRSQRDTGSKTELEKIMDGFGDWLFYGHATVTESGIVPWWVIDLNVFRNVMGSFKLAKFVQSGKGDNGDGTHFTWYDVRTFPANCKILVASRT